jgi:hypothetical protein
MKYAEECFWYSIVFIVIVCILSLSYVAHKKTEACAEKGGVRAHSYCMKGEFFIKLP